MGNRKKILWEAVKRLIAMILACVGASRLTAIILTIIHWQFMKMYFVGMFVIILAIGTIGLLISVYNDWQDY